MTELFKTDGGGENVKHIHHDRHLLGEQDPWKTALTQENKVYFKFNLTPFLLYFGSRMSPYPLDVYEKATRFPQNTMAYRLTDWLGLNLIQDLDRHILEAYPVGRFPTSRAYIFCPGFA